MKPTVSSGLKRTNNIISNVPQEEHGGRCYRGLKLDVPEVNSGYVCDPGLATAAGLYKVP